MIKRILIISLLSFNVMASPNVVITDCCEWLGAYLKDNDTVYINKRVDLNTKEGLAIKEHELCHRRLDKDISRYECQAEVERGAYDCENEYRWKHDLPLVPQSHINKMSGCT